MPSGREEGTPTFDSSVPRKSKPPEEPAPEAEAFCSERRPRKSFCARRKATEAFCRRPARVRTMFARSLCSGSEPSSPTKVVASLIFFRTRSAARKVVVMPLARPSISASCAASSASKDTWTWRRLWGRGQGVSSCPSPLLSPLRSRVHVGRPTYHEALAVELFQRIKLAVDGRQMPLDRIHVVHPCWREGVGDRGALAPKPSNQQRVLGEPPRARVDATRAL